MSWIALSDQTRQVFDLGGIAPGRAGQGVATPAEAITPHSLLVRGSILFETRLPGDGRPRTLLSFRREHPWVSSLLMQELPSGGIALVITQGADVFHTVLQHDAVTQAEKLRVTYSWDAPRRWARMAIERIGAGKVFLQELRNPKPLLLSDLRLMTLDPEQRQLDRSISYLAISDQVEPIGPMPSLTLGLPVLTAEGYRRAGHIRRGDLLRTPEGTLVPVLQVLRRTVPARGGFAPVKLRAPYFGLQQDVVVGAGQQLRSAGSEEEYLFGRPQVRLPAAHLINGVSAIACDGLDTITYCQFVTPGNDPCLVAGTTLETQFLGRCRRDAALIRASLLATADRAHLPEHQTPAYPVLDHFEAVTLASLRAA